MKTIYFSFAIGIFVAGYVFANYRHNLAWMILKGWYSFLVLIYFKPKYRYMERYVRKRGWYNPILESKNPDSPGPWSSPEIWSHPNDKNPEYNELGYGLYAAYLKCKGRDIFSGKKL